MKRLIMVFLLGSWLFVGNAVQSAESVTLEHDIDVDVMKLDDLFSHGDHDWKNHDSEFKKAAARLVRYDAPNYSLEAFKKTYKKFFTEEELIDLWYKVKMNNLLLDIGVNWPTQGQYDLFMRYHRNLPAYLQSYALIKEMYDFVIANQIHYVVIPGMAGIEDKRPSDGA